MAARRLLTILLLPALFILASCQLAALIAGKGVEPAKYSFPKKANVLVLVDPRDGVTVPPAFPTTLADKISSHLSRYKATDHLVSQNMVLTLEQADPHGFKTMGIADIARATGADVVVRVYITQWAIPISEDGLVAQGESEAFVKVVDKSGARLYPAEPAGIRVDAQASPALLSERETSTIVNQMTDDLAMRAGRMFHAYNREDADLTDQVPH